MSSNGSFGAIVFGTNFGVNSHVAALRGAGFEVKALIGRDPAKTKARAEWAKIPVALTSLEEAMALPGVDLVSISTPPHTHAEIALAAFAAGKNVVCEKPFARDLAEGQKMLDAARAAGVVHVIGHEHRFDVTQSLATQAVRAGVIGEPRMFTHLMSMPMFADEKTQVPDWWGDESQGGGWLGANGIHMLDVARNLMGEITGVSATLTTISNHGWTAEDSFSIHFRTEHGTGGVVQSSISDMAPLLFATRVAGTKGGLWVEDGKVFVADASGQRELEPGVELIHANPQPSPSDLVETTYDALCQSANAIGPYTCLYTGVREQMEGKEPTHPTRAATFEDGVIGQRLLDAVRRSSREGSWVEVG
jgi:predicted dehydrogenase